MSVVEKRIQELEKLVKRPNLQPIQIRQAKKRLEVIMNDPHAVIEDNQMTRIDAIEQRIKTAEARGKAGSGRLAHPASKKDRASVRFGTSTLRGLMDMSGLDDLGDSLTINPDVPEFAPSPEDRIAALEAQAATLRDAVARGPVVGKYVLGVTGETTASIQVAAKMLKQRYGCGVLTIKKKEGAAYEEIADRVADLDQAVVAICTKYLLRHGLRAMCHSLWVVSDEPDGQDVAWASAVLPVEAAELRPALARLWTASVPAHVKEVHTFTLRALHVEDEDIALERHEVLRCGRGDDCQVKCTMPGVSRLMCEISWSDGDWIVTDHARNGTFVNMQKIGTGNTRVLEVGDVLMLYKLGLKEKPITFQGSYQLIIEG